MDIGTGKDLEEYEVKGARRLKGRSASQCIPYHLIDVVEPNEVFTLADFQRLADQAIKDILKQNKRPIIVGGTGLYLQALVDEYKLSDTAGPDKKFRERQEKLSVAALFARLTKQNPAFANKLNNSDKNNKRRLVRYLEIGRKPHPPTLKLRRTSGPLAGKESGKDYEYLILGLTWPKEILHKRIYKRLIERLEKEDMVAEADRLHNKGVSWQRLESFGLEYKFIALYLQEKLDYEQMVEELYIAIKKFAKHQLTWLRRWERQGQEIHWLKDKEEARKLADRFLK